MKLLDSIEKNQFVFNSNGDTIVQEDAHNLSIDITQIKKITYAAISTTLGHKIVEESVQQGRDSYAEDNGLKKDSEKDATEEEECY